MEDVNCNQRVNLYVKNLDKAIDDERLRKEFAPFGTITSAKVVTEAGRSKGYGFVCFSSPEEAAKAITEMNDRIVGSERLYVALAQRKKDRQKHLRSQYMQRMANMSMHQTGPVIQPETSGDDLVVGEEPQQGGTNASTGMCNLYVKNLDTTIDDERLRKEFDPFGTITSAKVMMEEGRSKGFGFVRFSSSEEAKKAIAGMNDRTVGSKRLYVALAQRKEDRKAHLCSQYKQRMAKIRMHQMGPFIQPGTSDGYFVPTIQPQRFYGAAQVAQMKTTPRWPAQTIVRPGLQGDTNTHTGIPNSYRTRLPNQAPITRGKMSIPTPTSQLLQERPLAGQNIVAGDTRVVNYKYTSNMRNPPQPLSMGGTAQARQTVHMQGQVQFTISMLADVPSQEEKQAPGASTKTPYAEST